VPTAEGLETRLRTALWFAVHLVVGGVVGLAAVTCLPLTLVAVLLPFDGAAEAMRDLTLGPLDAQPAWWLTLIGVLVAVALLYAVAGLGTLAATMAPALLGPSPGARIAVLEAESVRLAERNRLARELHDSVGHALTVTTLQAAAARQLLVTGSADGTDLAFVGRALAAIEETGRSAMTDLDTVLGVLRADQPPSTTVSRSLRDLGRLLDETGAKIDLRIDGRLDGVPPVVSREGYRIVQESLTNALRHAAQSPVIAHLSTVDDALEVTVSNPLTGSPGAPGRGLAGMAERVTLLGGRFTAGPANGVWSVAARLPFGGRP
jgi:signal transduction histidine kinase